MSENKKDKSEQLPDKKETDADYDGPDTKPEILKGIPRETLKNLPPEVRKSVEVFLSMQRSSGGPHPLLAEKITSEHVTAIIENREREDEREYNYATSQRRFNLIYFFTSIALFVFLVMFLVETDKQLLMDIFKVLVGIIGGFGGGYGYRVYRERKK